MLVGEYLLYISRIFRQPRDTAAGHHGLASMVLVVQTRWRGDGRGLRGLRNHAHCQGDNGVPTLVGNLPDAQ